FVSGLGGKPRPKKVVEPSAPPKAYASLIIDGKRKEVPVAEGEAIVDAALRLQGRHVLDLPRQAGRGRGADGPQLFAGAVGAEGGLYPDLPGQAGFGKGRGRLRSRVIVIPRQCQRVRANARPDDRLRIELWCAIAHLRISRFRVWSLWTIPE